MSQRMAFGLLLLFGLSACGGGGGGSLPISEHSTLPASNLAPNIGSTSSRSALSADAPYTYTAPWGGFGAPGSIYVLGQSLCNDIPASAATGFSWPAFLKTLATGTLVTITGTPSYSDAWSKAHNCPTGGIVATSVVIGNAPSPSPSPTTGGSAITLDAGGPAVGSWAADADFSSGTNTFLTTSTIDTTRVLNPAPISVYQTHRWGKHFSYAIPHLTPLATYTVRLHFAETYWAAPAKRVFDISINSVSVFSNLDIFAAAGGENIAIVKQYSAIADITGTLNITFAATVDNALVSGIQISAGSAGPSPLPSPVISPSPSPTPISIQYPRYSSLFRASNNPFHMTFEAIHSLPGQVKQPANATSMSNNLWNQGAGKYQTVRALPFYQGVASDPAYSASCIAYSSKGCGAQGMTVHLPKGWAVQPGTDRHVTIVDLPGGHEADLWGGYNNGSYNGPYPCNVINGATLNCSWGGDYSFDTKGLKSKNNNGSGVAGGMAEGLFEITSGDLLSAEPIQHALGMQAACLDNDFSQGTSGAVYPSSRPTGTDGACSSFGMPSGAPPYGAMWHLKSSVNINSLGYGPYCTKIVQAMQTYGMYLMDTGNGQDQLEVENPMSYDGPPYSSNPFYKTIWPSMVGSGDGSGSGSNFAFGGCFNRLNANDMEIYYDPPGLGF